jgi:hypothetical protein
VLLILIRKVDLLFKPCLLVCLGLHYVWILPVVHRALSFLWVKKQDADVIDKEGGPFIEQSIDAFINQISLSIKMARLLCIADPGCSRIALKKFLTRLGASNV